VNAHDDGVMKMDRLILVRHGETQWNARKVLQGQSDISLSERGTAQAQALHAVVKRFEPHTAVCSDLSRAWQTAQYLGWGQARRDAQWREADLGDWTGKDVATLKEAAPQHYQRWRDGQTCPPNGEDFVQFKVRISKAIDGLSVLNGNVLVVTHGGVIRAALSVLIGLHPDRIVAVDPASVTVFQMSGSPRLLHYNVLAEKARDENSD
jgi:glucosyl-3-phosphoglycerate phosphatase